MLARAHAFTIDGLNTQHVTVEVDVRAGLPAFAIVGLADAAVREARERIQAAIRNCGYEFPARRITANLAPGDIPKAGPGLDLALACALLAASEQIPHEQLEHVVLFGELALDGGVRPSRGTLAVAQATRQTAGLKTLALASESAREASLIDGLGVAALERLSSAVRVLSGGPGDPLPPPSIAASVSDRGQIDTSGRDLLGSRWDLAPGADLSDISGQHQAVKALIIAAAGGHNCLLSGPPGVGKTMLAQRVVSVLPPLSRSEAIQVASIRSLAGERSEETLSTTRPFRAPHHTTTTAGLLGGASRSRVGEIVLAHNGVLFLDELSEFSRRTLEALRQPLEDGCVAISRARHTTVYPARFMLLAATNPCPCGYAGEAGRCRCTESELARHRRRLSGPLLDRFDLRVNLHRDSAHDLAPRPLTSSARARLAILRARERQKERFGVADCVNAHMDVPMLRAYAKLDLAGEELMRKACESGLLSARGEHRVLRLARTVADLRESVRIHARDVATALALRP